MDKEYIDSPQYWVRQHIIGKAYNVDKYTLNRFIEALEWQVTENEQLQKKFEEAIKHLKFTSHAAEYVYQPDKQLHKGIDPTFYHTLTYEGDLKLIEQTKAAREFLRSLDRGK